MGMLTQISVFLLFLFLPAVRGCYTGIPGLPGFPGLDGLPGQPRPPPHLPNPAAPLLPQVPAALDADHPPPIVRPKKVLLPQGVRPIDAENSQFSGEPASSAVDFKLKPSGFQPVVPLRSDEEVISRLVGNRIRTAKYNNAAFYDKSGAPVLDQRELSCDFGGDCCWANTEFPADQLQWRLAEGAPDRNKFSSFFGPFRGRTVAPEGRFLILGTHGSVASDEAQFVSCLITCTEGPIRLQARHWSTPNTLLRVCRRNGFEPEGPLFDCVELPRVQSPGPTTVEINAPQDSPSQLVIVAANLVGPQGDIAILDDISVKYTACPGPVHRPRPNSPESGRPTVTLPPFSPLEPLPPPVDSFPPPLKELGTECQKGSCSFENNNACSFANLGPPSTSEPFAVISGRFGNLLSGIRYAGDGDYYAAVELLDRSKAALAADTNFQEERIIRFKYYEATDGIQLSACCDSVNHCPFKTAINVDPSDRTWRTGSFLCPSGTKQIIFLCDNTRTNVGVCGLDSIQIYATADSNRPEDARIPC